MQGHGWQFSKQVTVPGSGTNSVSLPPARPVLEALSVWASSGARTITSLTFQPRINGKNLGTAVVVSSAKAADLVFEALNSSGSRLLPVGVGTLSAPVSGADAFDFDILITNGDTVAAMVTLYFDGIGRDGGAL